MNFVVDDLHERTDLGMYLCWSRSCTLHLLTRGMPGESCRRRFGCLLLCYCEPLINSFRWLILRESLFAESGCSLQTPFSVIHVPAVSLSRPGERTVGHFAHIVVKTVQQSGQNVTDGTVFLKRL